MIKKLILALVITVIVPLHAHADLSDGLIAEYLFNGNANDTSGNNYHGTNYGASIVADRFGNSDSAYYFDGTDKITADISPFSVNSQGISLAAWMNVDSLLNYNHVISGIDGTDSLYFTVEQDRLGFRPQINWDNGVHWVADNGTLNYPDWFHVAMVWDGQDEAESVKYYINGSQYTAFIDYSVAPVNDITISTLYMGLRFGTQGREGQPLIGILDDVYVYDRTLSGSEVQELFNASTSVAPEPISSTLFLLGGAILVLKSITRKKSNTL